MAQLEAQQEMTSMQADSALRAKAAAVCGIQQDDNCNEPPEQTAPRVRPGGSLTF